MDQQMREYLDAAMAFTATYGPARPRLLSEAAGYTHDANCHDDCTSDCTADDGMMLWIRTWQQGYLLNCGKVDEGHAAFRPRGEEPAVEVNGAWYTPEAAKDFQVSRLLDAIFGDDDD